jgi:hypothetical protein
VAIENRITSAKSEEKDFQAHLNFVDTNYLLSLLDFLMSLLNHLFLYSIEQYILPSVI